MPGKVVPETDAAEILCLIETLKANFLLPACTYCMIAFSHVYDDRCQSAVYMPKKAAIHVILAVLYKSIVCAVWQIR